MSEAVDPPTRAEIAKRAHELYLPRGGTHGYDLDDWLQAEREFNPAGPEKPLTTQGGRAKVQSAQRQARNRVESSAGFQPANL